MPKRNEKKGGVTGREGYKAASGGEKGMWVQRVRGRGYQRVGRGQGIGSIVRRVVAKRPRDISVMP